MQHFYQYYLYLIVLGLFLSFDSLGQGIKGKTTNEENELLPFATLYIEELGVGTTSNADAYFELKLPRPGTYTCTFKYVGYKTLTKKLTVSDDFLETNIQLQPNVILLNEVVAKSKKEDPANWMMQRAIAKSAYYRQLIDGYRARVYVKGKGRVTDIPFYLRPSLSKEGIDTSTLIITENISNIEFKRPNQFSEEVISVYASKKTDFNSSPMPYISSSFYEEEIAGAVSPLSQKAFKFYRFKHLGAYKDGDHLINRIKVTPRVPGPNVFEGQLHLVEEDWAIYNLDLKAQIEYGVNIHVKQVYQNLVEVAWMPLSHQIDIDGSIMGLGFEFKYLASLSNYEVFLNPDIPKELNLSTPEDKGSLAQEGLTEIDKDIQLKELKDKKLIVNPKDLPKIMEEYEKKQEDSLSKLDIIYVYNFEDDSAKYTQDSTFWDQIRPIPLSEQETKGYKKIDSLNVVSAAESAADSIKNYKKGTFELTDLITGGTYNLDSAKRHQFIIYNALFKTQYNTVDGFNVAYDIGYKYNLKLGAKNKEGSGSYAAVIKNRPHLLLKPGIRYAFAREKLNSRIVGKYVFRTGYFSIEGGNFVSQFNREEPVSPLMNTSFTVLWEQNLMKIYEKDYVTFNFFREFSDKLSAGIRVDLERRYRLYNNSFYSVVDWKRAFSPNLPLNANFYPDFDRQKALTTELNIEYIPFIKYSLRNGVKRPIRTRNSEFNLSYFKGIPQLFNSEVDFDRVELGYKDQFSFGPKGELFFNVKAGTFLNNNKMGFMDYAHFPGNISFLTQSDPVASYRLLDYYFYSTDKSYAQVFLFHQFRKLAITQIPAVRFFGIEESAFVNYLSTPKSNNYTELGYSIGGILKLFRVEFVANFEEAQYQGWGVRIGVNANLGRAD